MNITYINLDRDTVRRGFVEGNFAAHNTLGWTLRRVAAVDGRTLPESVVSARMTKGAVALSTTHRQVVRMSVGTPGHVMIAEDDILFGEKSQKMIETCIAAMEPQSWDLLFTDVCIPLPSDMVKLLVMKRKFGERYTTMNLRGLVFVGTTGVIVNERSKEKYLRLLGDDVLFSRPIDILIRDYIHQGHLNGFCTFPFATSISAHADQSEIQTSAVTTQNLLWNAYRRAMWGSADIEGVDAWLSQLPQELFQGECGVVGRIAAGLMTLNVVGTL